MILDEEKPDPLAYPANIAKRYLQAGMSERGSTMGVTGRQEGPFANAARFAMAASCRRGVVS